MKKSILTILVMAVLPSFVFADPEIVVTAPRPPKNDKAIMMKVTANYIVRNLNGDEVCHLRKGEMVAVTAVAPDSERVQITTPQGPCGGVVNGFVYINFLRPVSKTVDKYTETALVETGGLSLRNRPTVDDGTFSCSLPKNTKLNIIGESQKRTRWVEVEIENPPAGCPTKGWVAANYLKPDLDVASLPQMSAKALTEARTPKDCTDCAQGEVSGGRNSQVKKTAETAQQIERFVNAPPTNPQGPGVESPFTSFAKELQRTRRCPPAKSSDYKCNRGLMQMPTEGNAAFCGTHHYSPDRPPGVDTYTAPHTACSLVGLAQEWKKSTCPNDNAGCRIAWGDISHATRPYFNSHKEHTNGECIDIRPFNKGSFRDSGKTTSTPDYDRDTTVAFIKMAKKYGASVMYSDRKINNKALGVEWGGSMHNNHLHVCFEARNSTVKNACNNLNVDPQVCSEVQ